MANNLTNLSEIIKQMKFSWENGRCNIPDGAVYAPTFLFGYPQDVDDEHLKFLPLMNVNVPNSSSVIDEYEANVVNNNTIFKCQIYQYTPSEYKVDDDVLKSDHWDKMETCFYSWLMNVMNNLGSKVVLGNGAVQISRRTQSSNDQLLQIEVTFNFTYFRYCGTLEQ